MNYINKFKLSKAIICLTKVIKKLYNEYIKGSNIAKYYEKEILAYK